MTQSVCKFKSLVYTHNFLRFLSCVSCLYLGTHTTQLLPIKSKTNSPMNLPVPVTTPMSFLIASLPSQRPSVALPFSQHGEADCILACVFWLLFNFLDNSSSSCANLLCLSPHSGICSVEGDSQDGNCLRILRELMQ